MKPLYSLVLFFSLLTFGSVSAQSQYIFTANDLDGTTHDIQAYLDDGKPVLIYDFTSIDGEIWLRHEDGASIELYNTLGQGGSNEMIVLYIAGDGFNTTADITSIDYSSSLGTGYEDLDLTEDNPIPIILAADNPEVQPYPKGNRMWVCTQNDEVWLPYGFVNAEGLLSMLYNQCCTALEDEDLSLDWTSSTIFDPACDPTALFYQITNEAAIDQDEVAIDVYLNGDILETILYDELLEGCASAVLEYNNAAIAEGDQVTMAIGQPNANLSNDTITIVRDLVDTVGTTLKMEILDPYSDWSSLYFYTNNNSGNGLIDGSTNWFNYLFLAPGCYDLHLSTGEDPQVTDLLLVGTVDEDDQYTDTLYYGEFTGAETFMEFTLFADGEAAEQKVWGYIFEDVAETGLFSPDFPRIEGIQVSYGTFTTFTDANGYYEFPELVPAGVVSISYDELVWPVNTTPNAGNVGTENFIQNFGLSSSDPVWSLTSNFDYGLPYLCESGISNSIVVHNSGNQPTAGELVFTYDPILTPIDFNPEPTAINGNELTYAIPEIQFGGLDVFNIVYEEVSSDLLGEPITAAYTITSFDDNGDVVNVDSESITDTLFCAYDPNDIYGFPLGEGESGLIQEDTDLKYRIRFQNTGNLPATTVVIRDTLPETLDLNSFAPISASHAYSVILNSESREVVWTFANIMLPDSASDPMGSIGTLWYDIQMNDLEPGDQIETRAYIYFDENEPIVTNTSLHTIANPLSFENELNASFVLFPNPADDRVFLRGNISKNQLVRITDLSGRVVLMERIKDHGIDVSRLSPGLYIVSIGADRGRKLVIRSQR